MAGRLDKDDQDATAAQDGQDSSHDPLNADGKQQDVETKETSTSPPASNDAQDMAPARSQPVAIPLLSQLKAEHDPEATPIARDGLFQRHVADAKMAKAPEASTSGRATRSSTQTSMSALRARVCKAAATGDLETLITLLHPEDLGEPDDYPSSFALVNSPTSSGLTPLLEAASHGHLHVVRHLLLEEGAVRDLEDVEGENAFLKANYRGHLHVMEYLRSTEDGTDVNCADREGWTALHNAAGKGYLEIVMWLAERGARVDAKSRQGYTPLMNAASKGHLPIVNYLLTRHAPNPLLRNNYGETAFDVAVATFELGIADTLAHHESLAWRNSGKSGEYNPLTLHLTIPVILYENQRLDLRWQARAKQTLLATAAGSSRASASVASSVAPKFSSQALSRRDRHASFELPPSWEGLNSTGQSIPLRRTEIHPPTLTKPNSLPLPARIARGGPSSPNPGLQRSFSSSSQAPTPTTATSAAMSSSSSSASSTSSILGLLSPTTPTAPSHVSTEQATEPAWYFLSSFFVDLSPASVDPEQGWQYASSFAAPDEQWSSEVPEQVLRIMSGEQPPKNAKWVRRRRWARIMRRRLDVPDWGFADTSVPITGTQSSNAPAAHQSYLQRAKYFAGTHDRAHVSKRKGKHRDKEAAEAIDSASAEKHAMSEDDASSVRSIRTVIDGLNMPSELDRQDARRIVARLQRAIDELDEGMQDDENEGRKTEAWDLKKVFEERLLTLKEEWPSLQEGKDEDEGELCITSPSSKQADPDSQNLSGILAPTHRQTMTRHLSLHLSDQHQSTLLALHLLYLPYPSVDHLPSALVVLLRDNSPFHLQIAKNLFRSHNWYRQILTSVCRSMRHLGHSLLLPRPCLESTRQSRHRGGLLVGFKDQRYLGNQMRARANVEGAIANLPSSFASITAENVSRSTPVQTDSTDKHLFVGGLVVCAHCSPHQDWLRSSEVVQEPSIPGLSEPFAMLSMLEGGGYFRTCDHCHHEVMNAGTTGDDITLAAALDATGPTLQIGHVEGSRASPEMHRIMSDSSSELGECPVCGANLARLGDAAVQEEHIQTCLDSGAASSREPDNRYAGMFCLSGEQLLWKTDCVLSSLCFT